MQSKALSLTAVLALAFLAGCSDAPPAGTLVATDAGLAVTGSASNHYEAATQPVEGQDGVCVPVPPQGPMPDLRCTPASTRITAHFMSLPEPDGNGYSIILNGTTGQKNIGNLVESNGMYELNYTYPGEDYSTMYQTMELHMGDFVFATASAAEGDQPFSAAAGINGVTATGTFKGKTLDVDVGGLPAGSQKYLGRLYTMGEDGNLTATASFDIVAGPNHFEDEKNNIGDYAEFHIHVGNSKINLFKATIQAK